MSVSAQQLRELGCVTYELRLLGESKPLAVSGGLLDLRADAQSLQKVPRDGGSIHTLEHREVAAVRTQHAECAAPLPAKDIEDPGGRKDAERTPTEIIGQLVERKFPREGTSHPRVQPSAQRVVNLAGRYELRPRARRKQTRRPAWALMAGAADARVYELDIGREVREPVGVGDANLEVATFGFAVASARPDFDAAYEADLFSGTFLIETVAKPEPALSLVPIGVALVPRFHAADELSRRVRVVRRFDADGPPGPLLRWPSSSSSSSQL